jgi:hypothetical protein
MIYTIREFLHSIIQLKLLSNNSNKKLLFLATKIKQKMKIIVL